MLLLWIAVLSAGTAMAYENERPDAIRKMVDGYRQDGKVFTRMEVFTPAANNSDISFLRRYSTFTYNRNTFDYLYDYNIKFISVTVYIDKAPVELMLVKQNFFTKNVVVGRAGENGVEEMSNTSNIPELGVHYTGYIIGQENTSVASLSLFNDIAYGLVSSESLGNVTIGKLKKDKADDSYISFKSGDFATEVLEKINRPHCGTNTNTPENGYGTPQQLPANEKTGGNDNSSKKESPVPPAGSPGPSGTSAISFSPSSISGKCVKLFLDVSSDIYTDLGSDYNATRQYGIALVAQSASLYLNEGILLQLSQINIWTSGCPYPGTPDDLTARLNSFKSTWGGGYNGDIAMMIDEGTQGGRAHVNSMYTFCSPDPRDRMGYNGVGWYVGADLASGFNFYIPMLGAPDVESFTHEIGHILGCAHTHDCVWGSSGTSAIDGCGPNAAPYYSTCTGCAGSGSCATGPIPPKGTIMSYCHLDPPNGGIDLTLGFGSQPNARMLVVISAAGCLGDCAQHCPYSYTFYNRTAAPTVNFPFTWNAYYFIQSSARYTLVSGDHLEYNAGKYINLYPGFETQITAGQFLAHIGGCTPDPYDESNNDSNPKPGGYVGGDISITDVPGNKYGISIYPNPTTGFLTLTIPGKEDYDVRVVNVMGSTVHKIIIPGNSKYTLQLPDNVPPGNYTIHITGKDVNFVEKLSVIK